MTICTMVLFLSISKQYYGRSWRRNWPYVMLQFPEFYLYKKIGFEKKNYMPFLRIILIATIKEYNYPTPQACRVVKMLGHSWEPIHHSWDWKQLRWIQSHSWWMGSTCDPTFLTTRRLRRRVVLYSLIVGYCYVLRLLWNISCCIFSKKLLPNSKKLLPNSRKLLPNSKKLLPNSRQLQS